MSVSNLINLTVTRLPGCAVTRLRGYQAARLLSSFPWGPQAILRMMSVYRFGVNARILAKILAKQSSLGEKRKLRAARGSGIAATLNLA